MLKVSETDVTLIIIVLSKAPFTLRTAPYVHVRHCTATCGTAPYDDADTADSKLYATYRYCQWVQLRYVALSSVAVRQRNATQHAVVVAYS